MIVILLGILDIISALSIFTLGFSWGPTFVWFSIVYLLIKSIPFIKSFASIIDIIVAIIFIVAILTHPSIITYIGSVWLIQKGIISFF